MLTSGSSSGLADPAGPGQHLAQHYRAAGGRTLQRIVGRPALEAFSWARYHLASNAGYRQRLQHIVDAVRPAHLMHGHMHRVYQRTCDFSYGPSR